MTTRPPDVPLDELLAGMHVVAVPLRTRFRGIRTREVALLRGPAGWGEFGPFLEYDDRVAVRWLAAALESAWAGWPPPRRSRVPVNATLPAVPAREVAGVLARYDGCGTVKVKVAEAGQSLADDIARVSAVRDIAGSAARVRIDANGGWSLDDAVDAIDALSRFGLEYAEQPCATVEDLARVRIALARRGLDVPVAADESIRRADDPLRVAELDAADLVVVKVAPLGGVRAALDIVDRVGLPAVVSSAIDTSVGIRAGVALAAALPELPYACGLGTIELLRTDVATTPLVPVGGELPVADLAVDADALTRSAASPEREAWWRQRIVRVHRLLHEQTGVTGS